VVVKQSVIFAVTAVIFKAVIGFFVALRARDSNKGQRKWRGMLPWVIRPRCDAGVVLALRPVVQCLQLDLVRLGLDPLPWLGQAAWARSVILVNVWYGAPFFLIMSGGAEVDCPSSSTRRRRSTA
jgi:multiple sugar transport system permease protein